MKKIGTINPAFLFWIKLGIGMYFALEMIGMFFTAVGAI